jgi:hypothetical protein
VLLGRTALAMVSLVGVGCEPGEVGPLSPVRASCDPASAVGDLSLPIELSMVVPSSEGGTTPLLEGADVPLVESPQGGKIIVLGTRARNLVGGNVQVGGWLLDESTGNVYGLEDRPAHLIETDDGWAEPERPESFSNYAHVAACPAANLPRDVHDQRWEIVLRIEDCRGETAEVRLAATPRCLEPTSSGQCACECSQSYSLGDTCQGPSDPPPDPPPDDTVGEGCVSATAASAPRIHHSMTPQSGVFTTIAEITPQGAVDAAVALSSGAVTEWADLAAIVQFRPDGEIVVRDGDAYLTTGATYQTGSAVRVRLVADVAAGTYAAYLTPPGAAEITLGTGLAFRNPGITELDTWDLFADAGSVTGCDLTMP